MTTPTFDPEHFDRMLIQPLRDGVAALGERDEVNINVPLALLEMRLRLALEAYDASEGEPE